MDTKDRIELRKPIPCGDPCRNVEKQKDKDDLKFELMKGRSEKYQEFHIFHIKCDNNNNNLILAEKFIGNFKTTTVHVW